MGKAADKLAELLERREEELETLRSEIEAYKDNERWRWARHAELPEKQSLPVPRLEVWLDENNSDDYNRIWVYRMIYRHLLGHCVAVPLGMTTQQGEDRHRKLLDYLPFRDGAHIRNEAHAWKWPAFIVRGKEHAEIPTDPDVKL